MDNGLINFSGGGLSRDTRRELAAERGTRAVAVARIGTIRTAGQAALLAAADISMLESHLTRVAPSGDHRYSHIANGACHALAAEVAQLALR
jgi:hypothetical protein